MACDDGLMSLRPSPQSHTHRPVSLTDKVGLCHRSGETEVLSTGQREVAGGARRLIRI